MIWLLIFLVIKNLVCELNIRGRKLNICLVFIAQSYFAVPKIIVLFYNENSKQMGTLANSI